MLQPRRAAAPTALQRGTRWRAAHSSALPRRSSADRRHAAAAFCRHDEATAEVQPSVAPEHAHLTHLAELWLSDFALVPSARVRLAPGLTAISGSSGAGKSVLLEALAALLGGTPPPDVVRPPAQAAVIEGRLWLAHHSAVAVAHALAEAGLPQRSLPGGDGEGGGSWLHLRREICRSSSPAASPAASAAAGSPAPRSRVTINGTASSLRVLRALGSLLVDVNGQAASAALRDSSSQLGLLDRVAGTSALAAQLGAWQARLSSLEAGLSRLAALGDDEERAALQRRVDIINKASLKPGEDVTLRRRLAALESRRSCLETAATLRAGMRGDSGGGGMGVSGPAGSCLLDALALVSSQLRGLVASEEQQQRLASAERRQRASAQPPPRRDGADSPAASAAAAGRAASDADAAPGMVGGQATQAGAAEAALQVEEGEEGEAEGEQEEADEQADEEASATAAALRALRAALEELEAADDSLREAHAQLADYASAAGYSPSEAATLSSRLELITKLARRFRANGASGLLQLRDAWSSQLEDFYATQGQAEEWRAEAAQLQASIGQLALRLSRARAAAAGRLATAVQAQLGELAMGSSRFGVQLSWREAVGQAQPSSRALLLPLAAQPAAMPLCAAGSHQPQQPAAAPAASSLPEPGSALAAAGAVPDANGATPHALFALGPHGLDLATFLLAAGPAEPLRPLADIASGGEAARIMLALKAAAATAAAPAAVEQAPAATPDAASGAGAEGLAAVASSSSSSSSSSDGGGGADAGSPPPVLLLDELDAGVGSRLGEPVGRLLRGLVAGPRPSASQVLVVTHTPQVAAAASHHIQVVKSAAPDGRVTTAFRQLAHTSERVAELADMLGLPAQEGAAVAAELLQQLGGKGAPAGCLADSRDTSWLAGLSAAAAAAGAASAAAASAAPGLPQRGDGSSCG